MTAIKNAAQKGGVIKVIERTLTGGSVVYIYTNGNAAEQDIAKTMQIIEDIREKQFKEE